MKPKVQATQADVLDAIRAALGPAMHTEPGISASEYAIAEGTSPQVARKRLERAVKAGTLVRGAGTRRRSNNAPYPVPVYRMAE